MIIIELSENKYCVTHQKVCIIVCKQRGINNNLRYVKYT